jgi:hypothetical protein
MIPDGRRSDRNYKPYWGDYAKARTIHFYGPTPYQREFIDSHFSELKDLTGGCYQELCDLWADVLEEAR